MRHLKLFSSAAIFCLSAFAAVGVSAQTWDFTGNNNGPNSNPPCTVAAPCGQVTVNVTSSTLATFTVTSLDTGYVFDTFGFNAPNVALTLVSSSGEVGDGSKKNNTPTLGGAGNEDGFGSFDYNFDTGLSGGSKGDDCKVTLGVPNAGCTFSFTVKGTGLTLSLFDGGAANDLFAAHLANKGGTTGYVSDTVPGGSINLLSTPEGAGVPMLGVAAIALLGTMALKKRTSIAY